MHASLASRRVFQRGVMSALCAGLALLALAGAARAAGMHVAPLRLDLVPQRPVASLVIGNPEQAEFAVQAEAVAWSQDNGRDVYTPTRDVLINPSIFRIPAGGQQIVRVGLQVGAQASERSYRVFVRQLPQEREGAPGMGLQTLLRVGIPVFVPATQAVESLEWRLVPGAAGGHELVLDNRGTTHIQITSLAISREGGGELLRRNLSHYVLPGRSMPIVLEAAALPALPPGTPLRVEAVAAGGRALPPLVLRVPHAPAAAR